MPQRAYEAEIEIPLNLESADELIASLREYAHPRIVVRIPARSQREAASLLAESTDHYGLGFDAESWNDRLRGIRSADARRRADDSFGGDREVIHA
ncbi:hypothetical protein [Curtobacterium sp. MCBD17_040]|uniref:hypothetical protein n=1 Tax=Curtobacterium sp. MCBD17_040 TaxID=2175674 RepID=UPI000DA89624|nr:hypothetical protein [Curtobacterium sp. MCBD17_040]WIB65338.1 hypothetical protein DEI94_18195 [Curtobacterium sp. MCBD17_040]